MTASKLHTRILLILALLLGTLTTGAQTYFYRQYNKEEGLSQSQALCLFQDKYGQLYIGTNGGGLNIYNGKEFKKYTNTEGLAGNVVFSVTSDAKGQIWIATFGGGISIMKNGEFKNLTKKF